jgi:hypothetical protein
MYRGVLFTQLGDFSSAKADHAKLLKLDAQLAARLELAISKAATGEDRGGISGQYE